MRRPGPVAIAVVAAIVAVPTGACGGDKKAAAPKTTTTVARPSTTVPTVSPNCQAVPPPGQPFTWLPSDLPMPPGTYAVKETSLSNGSKAGTMVVASSLTDFVKFALAEYPKAGYRLGRGDSEQGEAEDNFVKGTSGGAWRIRSSYCDPGKSELFITYIPDVNKTPVLTPSTTAAGPQSTLGPG